METLASGSAAPANADNTATAETGEADAKPTEATGEGTAPSVPEADTPARKDPVQERIDKLTRDKYDALREADRTKYELERLSARLAELEKAPTEQVAPATDFPTLEQYGYDEGKYQAAVAAHFSKLASEQGKQSAEAALKAERERISRENAVKGWASREAELIKSKPEYVEKVQNASTLPISQEIQQVLLDHELGPQIALHMVENAEQARMIMRLPFNAQLMEVGRITAKLEAAKAAASAKPPVSQAPPPVNKVETSDAPAEKNPGDMSDAEFAKWRKKQIAQRRGSR